MQTITAKELVNKKDERILVLDIRDSSNFNEWNIKNSKNIDVYSDIWKNNFDKVKQKLSQLPKDKKIVTVCNAGVTSQKASMLLESLGYKTLVLNQGMMGWNKLHQSIDILNETDLLIKQIIRIGKGCLSYLIGSSSTKECFIVDPSQFTEEYIELARNIGFKIKGVIETHVHADHLSGAKQLTELIKTKYYVSGNDSKAEDGFVDLNKLERISIGKNEIKVIKTPGHTDGSVCLLVNNTALLTGDTLFLDGVGRPDLRRNGKEIERGVKLLFSSLEKIKRLDKNLIILPAHFTDYDILPVSEKLSDLLKNNKTLGINFEKEFVKYILNNLPISPPNYRQIKNLNTSCSQVPREIGEKLEFGPNRCASK